MGTDDQREKLVGLYDPRSRAEIHAAIESTKNSTTKAALEWVLKLREDYL